MSSAEASWPEAPRDGWLDTAATLQMWSQVVGKVRLALAPRENHWWHIVFYLTARGFTTSPIPDGARTFQIDFDFIDHRLIIATSDNKREVIPLAAMPVAAFYAEVMARLAALRIEVKIWPVPTEVLDATPFPERTAVSDYRPEIAESIWRIFSIADMALKRFRGDFLGKTSPSHVFWGALDLAMTRFSGRRAPEHPGGGPNLADWVTREAYSHEVWSAGFWPGTAGSFERPAFYAYAYPEPEGFSRAPVETPGLYHPTLREFLLPYDEVRALPNPPSAVAEFLRRTYLATAELGHWPRHQLERQA
jgi:hypothetical protein